MYGKINSKSDWRVKSEEWRERESAVSAFVMQYFAVFSEKGIVFLIFTLQSENQCQFSLWQHRTMGQGDSARDFDTSESMKNVGILDVFPIFRTARLGKKLRRSPQSPLCGVALKLTHLK